MPDTAGHTAGVHPPANSAAPVDCPCPAASPGARLIGIFHPRVSAFPVQLSLEL